MPRAKLATLLIVGLALVAPSAQAFVFRVGDTVYVDGKQYSWEEWKKIRDTYGKNPDALATAKPAPGVADDKPRAGSCLTRSYYEEFPADDERFECTAGLGLQTRDELLKSGWKIDLIEKVPASGEGRSSHGLPLFKYKLVISR